MKRIIGSLLALLLFHLQFLQQITFSNGAPGGSGERVHIKVHMPEIVRKHTHFHKVYKQQQLHPVPSPVQLFPLRVKKIPKGTGTGSMTTATAASGKPRVSLLGYTMAASGAGSMAPSVMHLMSTHAAPVAASTMAPNYGPALFDNLNQQLQMDAEQQDMAAALMLQPTAATTISKHQAKRHKQQQQETSNNSALLSYPAKQQLLKQIFTPNVMAAITAAQGESSAEFEDASTEQQQAEHTDDMESNSLLNTDFLAALQREYMQKFGASQMFMRHKRKKYGRQGIGEQSLTRPYEQRKRPTSSYNYNSNNNYFNELNDLDDLDTDEYAAPYAEPHINFYNNQYEHEMDDPEDMEDVNSYGEADSAVALSGSSHDMKRLPTVDEFMEDVSSSSSGPPNSLYANMYDAYVSAEESNPSGSSEMWQPSTMEGSNYFKQQFANRPTTTTGRPRSQQRRPAALGYKGGGVVPRKTKLRFVKAVAHRKRKNRIKTKRHRVY